MKVGDPPAAPRFCCRDSAPPAPSPHHPASPGSPRAAAAGARPAVGSEALLPSREMGIGTPHRVSQPEHQPHSECRGPTSAVRARHGFPEPHVSPLLGIGALCWASEPPIISISSVGCWSSILGIAAPHDPQIRHWLSEPCSGCCSPISALLSFLHWVSEHHVGHQGLTLGVRAWHWMPEPCINPIIFIGALYWALGPFIGHWSPSWGSWLQYQPCIHPRVPEPLVGWHRPGITAPRQVPLAPHWALPPTSGIMLSLSPLPHAQPGFLSDPVGLTPVEQKGPLAP